MIKHAHLRVSDEGPPTTGSAGLCLLLLCLSLGQQQLLPRFLLLLLLLGQGPQVHVERDLFVRQVLEDGLVHKLVLLWMLHKGASVLTDALDNVAAVNALRLCINCLQGIVDGDDGT